MSLQGVLELRDRYPFLGTGLYLDSEHAEAVDKFQQAVVSGCLDGNDVPFRCHRSESKQQRFLATIGDPDVFRIHLHARRIQVVIGDLPPQRRLSEGRCVTDASVFGACHDPFHRPVQAFRRGLRHRRVCNAERHQRGIIDAVVDAFHEAAAHQGRGITVERRGRSHDLVCGHVPDVESGLRRTILFQPKRG